MAFSKETLSTHGPSVCSLQTVANFRFNLPTVQKAFLAGRVNGGPVAGQPRRQQRPIWWAPAVTWPQSSSPR